MYPQSGTVDYASETTEKQSTVTFKDMADTTTTRLTSSLSDRAAAGSEEVGYQKFFSRPVKIADYQWNVNSALDVQFNPWSLWLSDSRVSNRLNNFLGFAGHLHLKVVINGNPFYWGGAQLSYFPQGGATFPPPWYSTDINYYGDLMSASQRMKIFIDPTLSQGGEMVLPFIWPLDTLDLTDIGDFNRVGVCWLSSLADLKHATSTEALTISVYAWCDDVVLTSPTVNNVAFLSPQMGKVDEHQIGPVEKTSAIISQVSGQLTKVPVIGKYAMASKMGADLVTNVASKFGLCKPRQINDTMNYRLQQAGDLACIDSLDTSQTLALNAKREVTIDPVSTGVGEEDELDFRNFSGRESLNGFFDWRQDQMPDDLLYSTHVTPRQAFVGPKSVIGGTTVAGVTMTPAAYLATNFTYWRGTMRVRIQVMSSSFHKGRLLLVWDPLRTTTTPEVQVQNSVIVDISEERDYVHEIKWGNPSPALEVGGLGPTIPISTTWNTDTILPLNNFANGMFSVYVLNRLTSSSVTSEPVRINVYTSFPDLEVYAPESGNELYSPYEVLAPALDPQMGYDATVVDSSAEMNVPGGQVSDTVGGGTELKLAAILHGDPVVNFRTLMKRFTLSEVLFFFAQNSSGNGSINSVTRTTYPIYRGPESAGLHNGSNLVPFNIRSKVSCCFVGYRGGMRYKFIPLTTVDNTAVQMAPYPSISRHPDAFNTQSVTNFSILNLGNINQVFSENDTSLSGMAYTSPPQGGILEIEMPWYSKSRFELNFLRPAIFSKAMGWELSSITTFNERNDINYRVYQAVADDYNVFGFTGIPTVYLYNP